MDCYSPANTWMQYLFKTKHSNVLYQLYAVVLITLPDGPCPDNLLESACENDSRSLLVEDCFPNALISSLKLALKASLSVSVLSVDVLLVLLSCAIRLCSLLSMSPLPMPIGGGGGMLPTYAKVYISVL